MNWVEVSVEISFFQVDLNKERYDDSLPGFISVKRKRSDYIPSIGDEEAKEAEEKLEEQKEIEPEDNDSDSAREYIKQFLALEDDENTNLANALNLATLAQVSCPAHFSLIKHNKLLF